MWMLAAAKGAAAGAGVGAAVWGATTTAANLLGFTAGGIAAGSTAAGMMSSAAIANGGGVAAGSTVAWLQSIGAVGLGAPVVVGLLAGGILLGAGYALTGSAAVGTTSAAGSVAAVSTASILRLVALAVAHGIAIWRLLAFVTWLASDFSASSTAAGIMSSVAVTNGGNMVAALPNTGGLTPDLLAIVALGNRNTLGAAATLAP